MSKDFVGVQIIDDSSDEEIEKIIEIKEIVKEVKKRKPRAKKVVEPKATTTGKNTPMALAKEIRKDGEKWTDAVKRAGKQLK